MTKSKKILIITAVVFLISALTLALTACSKATLPTPTNLSYDEDTLVLSWDEVAGADRYMIAVNGNVSSQFMTEKTSVNFGEISKIQEKLKSGAKNTAQVRAVNFSGNEKDKPTNGSEWSDPVEFTFTMKATAVTALDFDASANTLTFKGITNNSAVYRISYNLKGDSEVKKIDIPEDAITTKKLTGKSTIELAKVFASLPAGDYEITVITSLENYEDSDRPQTFDFHWTGGSDEPIDPDDPDDPDDPVDPDDPDDPDDPVDPEVEITSITAVYTGGTLNIGESINLSDLTVIGHYEGDGEADIQIEDYELSDIDTTTAGEKMVTVTYKGLTTTFTLTVVDDTPCTTHVDDDGNNYCDNCGEIIFNPVGFCTILGVNGDWNKGLEMTLNTKNLDFIEYMMLGFEVAEETAIKIYKDGNWFGYENLKSGAGAAPASTDAEGNIVLPAGKYDIYFDSTPTTEGDLARIWIGTWKCPHVDEDGNGACDDCGEEITTYTLNFNWNPESDGAKVYVWAWIDGQEGSWYEVSMSNGVGTVTLPSDCTHVKAVRFDPTSANIPDWSATIWDQSNDIAITGTTISVTLYKKN